MLDILPDIQPLLDLNRLTALGPGTPNLVVRAQLQDLARDLPAKAKDHDFALACVAGLWLHHDFFDESHAISQDLHTVEGSYWHGILHRREPDYWNAKYWMRQVGEHPIHGALHEASLKLASEQPCLAGKRWEAAAFVDLCEKQADPSAMAHDFCRKIQRIEWGLLFQYCYQEASFRELGAPNEANRRILAF